MLLFEYGKSSLSEVLNKLCLEMTFEECNDLLNEYIGELNKELNDVYQAYTINVVSEKQSMNLIYKLMHTEYSANLTYSIILLLFMMECNTNELKYIKEAFDYDAVYNNRPNVLAHLIRHNNVGQSDFRDRAIILFSLQVVADWIFTPISPITMEYEFKVLSSSLGKENVLKAAYTLAGDCKKLKAFLISQELSE